MTTSSMDSPHTMTQSSPQTTINASQSSSQSILESNLINDSVLHHLHHNQVIHGFIDQSNASTTIENMATISASNPMIVNESSQHGNRFDPNTNSNNPFNLVANNSSSCASSTLSTNQSVDERHQQLMQTTVPAENHSDIYHQTSLVNNSTSASVDSLPVSTMLTSFMTDQNSTQSAPSTSLSTSASTMNPQAPQPTSSAATAAASAVAAAATVLSTTSDPLVAAIKQEELVEAANTLMRECNAAVAMSAAAGNTANNLLLEQSNDYISPTLLGQTNVHPLDIQYAPQTILSKDQIASDLGTSQMKYPFGNDSNMQTVQIVGHQNTSFPMTTDLPMTIKSENDDTSPAQQLSNNPNPINPLPEISLQDINKQLNSLQSQTVLTVSNQSNNANGVVPMEGLINGGFTAKTNPNQIDPTNQIPSLVDHPMITTINASNDLSAPMTSSIIQNHPSNSATIATLIDQQQQQQQQSLSSGSDFQMINIVPRAQEFIANDSIMSTTSNNVVGSNQQSPMIDSYMQPILSQTTENLLSQSNHGSISCDLMTNDLNPLIANSTVTVTMTEVQGQQSQQSNSQLTAIQKADQQQQMRQNFIDSLNQMNNNVNMSCTPNTQASMAMAIDPTPQQSSPSINLSHSSPPTTHQSTINIDQLNRSFCQDNPSTILQQNIQEVANHAFLASMTMNVVSPSGHDKMDIQTTIQPILNETSMAQSPQSQSLPMQIANDTASNASSVQISVPVPAQPSLSSSTPSSMLTTSAFNSDAQQSVLGNEMTSAQSNINPMSKMSEAELMVLINPAAFE